MSWIEQLRSWYRFPIEERHKNQNPKPERNQKKEYELLIEREFAPKFEKYLELVEDGHKPETIEAVVGFGCISDIIMSPHMNFCMTRERIRQSTQARLNGMEKRMRRENPERHYLRGELRRAKALRNPPSGE